MLGVNPDAGLAAAVESMKAFVNQARALKAQAGVSGRRDVRFLVKAKDAAWATIEANLAKLLRMAGAAEIVRKGDFDGIPAAVTPLGTLGLDLTASVDMGAERQKLARELEALIKHIAATEARLANPAFVEKAPPAVLEGARRQLAEQKARRAELERLLK
jgi:valyl-tRNA synthetase